MVMERTAGEAGALGEAVVFLDYFKDCRTRDSAQSAVSAGRGVALVPSGSACRVGGDHRHRPVRREETRVVTAVPPVSRRNTFPRPPRRHSGDARRQAVPALLRSVGGGADRYAIRCDRHRRQDVAPIEEGGAGGDPYGFGVRRTPTTGAWASQGVGEV